MIDSVNPELPYWLAFDRITGINLGSRRLSKILDHFGSLRVAWEASEADLKQVPGLPASVAEGIVAVRSTIDLEDAPRLMEEKGVEALTKLDPSYPKQLLALEHPPFILYISGRWELSCLDKAVAIVGARKASEEGRYRVMQLAWHLAGLGYTVVSGIAAGIDSSAHNGAMRSERGYSIGVMAGGIDQQLNSNNRAILENLKERGTMVSEYPVGTPAERGFFPARNRIIAALAKACIVAEAKEGSGSLITARRALELGKPLYCLSHRANTGGMSWVRMGLAKPVNSYLELLEELQAPAPSVVVQLPEQETSKADKTQTKPSKSGKRRQEPKPQSKPTSEEPPNLSGTEKAIYEALSEDEYRSVDKLLSESGLSMVSFNSALTTMQLKGLLERNASGGLRRKNQA